MNEDIGKRIIAFTSQSLKEYGIHAVRMNDIARNMSMSKRTIYEIYASKENLIYLCFAAYQDRTVNRFQIIRCGTTDDIEYLWSIIRLYIENLYKAKTIFWLDIARSSNYQYIYSSYNSIWTDELKRIVSSCREENTVIRNINIDTYVDNFIKLLYNARVTEHTSAMLEESAYFMTRGILTLSGMKRFDYMFEKQALNLIFQ
ncbi:TetR/AcrR family transcriptional regulator [Phocaeicola sp.]|uniref:TetR/AcrR family transcriptional regulator n=1 Tax=Phocaeicola sp. TaxID=2773926 RepID=UPI002A8157C1|nr:TetR/AcrR family transcriptional regulator [Phocaeicola sp.]